MITRKELQDSIKKTFEQGIKIVEAKNTDYVSSSDGLRNFRSAELVGISIEKSILVRLMDKINRIINLLDRKQTVKDESITDSILDAINYLAILKAKLEDQK